MVLSLTADELVQAHFDALVQEGTQKQVGLVLGRCGSKRDLVVAVIPTPAVGGVDPVRLSRGNSGASSSTASISSDAVAEHARQTSLLLPGGLTVVGLFLFAPGGLSSAAATGGGGGEASLLSAWREAVRSSAASSGCRLGSSEGKGAGVLLGADASSRGRVAAKEIVAAAGASSSSPPLRHADIRFAPLLSKLVSLRTTYPVAARVENKKKNKEKKESLPLLALLSAAAEAEAARARCSLALGAAAGAARRPRPLNLDASVADSLVELGGPEGASSGAREVVLLPPAVSCSLLESDDGSDDGSESDGNDDNEGTLRLEGWVEARALVHERDSVREAVEALASDVGATVRARAAAAVEEAEAEAEEEEDGGEKSVLLSPPPADCPVVIPLARRVLFPLLPGGAGGSSEPSARVVGGDLALPPPKRNESGGRDGDKEDGEGALEAATQLCGRDDLSREDLVFAEGRAEGARAAGVSSSSSSRKGQQIQQKPRREAAAAAATAAPTAAPSAAATATASTSPMPLAAAGAVAAATLALALGLYLTLA